MSEPEEDEDGEDWFDLAATTTSLKPIAQILLTRKVLRRKNAKPLRAKAVLWLRHEAAEWIVKNEPRFKIQIGGKFTNMVRIIPDNVGRFEAGDFKGAKRIMLGAVNVWPDEERGAIEPKIKIEPWSIVLTLPADFARATVAPDAAHIAPSALVQKVRVSVQKKTSSYEQDCKEIKAAIGITDTFPQNLGGQNFPASERAILEALLKRAEMSKEALMLATHNGAGDDERDIKIIDVFISRIRQKLTPLGISIETIWGGSYRMDATSKARLRQFIDKAKDVA